MRYLLPLLFLLPPALSNAQWAPFSTGSFDGFIVQFETFQGDLYACGLFSKIGGKNIDHLARWDGTEWLEVIPNIGSGVHQIYPDGDALMLAKYEFYAAQNHALRWNGNIQTLSQLGEPFRYLASPGVNPSLYAITQYNGDYIIAGDFSHVGDNEVNGIARWDGTEWVALGSGLRQGIPGNPNIPYPHQLLVHEGELYAAGNFRYAGPHEANGIAKWDGQDWHPFGPGFDGPVYGIAFFEGELYAGGSFHQSGVNSLGNLAKWDGNNWVPVGIKTAYSNSQLHPYVHTLKVINDQLFALGGFDVCTSDSGVPIACESTLIFDGTNWNTMEDGVKGEAEAIIQLEDGRILIGGNFTEAGELTVDGMAVWQGTASSMNLAPSAQVPKTFPNPSDQQLTVESPGSFQCQLFNAQGQLIATQSGNDQIQIPAFLLPEGLYLLILTTEGRSSSQKIVVQH